MQKLNGVQNEALPASVNINNNYGGGYLGTAYDAFVVKNPQDALKGLVLEDPKSEKSMRLLKLMADVRRDFHKEYRFRGVEDYRQYYNESIKFMHSKDLDTFDLSKEAKDSAKKYDIPHGDKFLLARRLLDVDVQYISINIGGWDDHNELWDQEKFPKRAGDVDLAISTFLADLYERGLLDSTVVAVNTEFGRTPKISPEIGRGHFNKAFSGLLAGAGVKGGAVYGKTNDQGSKPIENPVSPMDFNATLAKLVGMDIEKEIFSSTNRPFTVARSGKPVQGVMI